MTEISRNFLRVIRLDQPTCEGTCRICKQQSVTLFHWLLFGGEIAPIVKMDVMNSNDMYGFWDNHQHDAVDHGLLCESCFQKSYSLYLFNGDSSRDMRCVECHESRLCLFSNTMLLQNCNTYFRPQTFYATTMFRQDTSKCWLCVACIYYDKA